MRCERFPVPYATPIQYNGATIHACAKKGSAACGKKSTKILKIYILALRVPGASLQAQRGGIAHVGTVHTWGQSARGDKEGKCYAGNISKREALRAKRSSSLIVIELAYSLGCNMRKRK